MMQLRARLVYALVTFWFFVNAFILKVRSGEGRCWHMAIHQSVLMVANVANRYVWLWLKKIERKTIFSLTPGPIERKEEKKIIYHFIWGLIILFHTTTSSTRSGIFHYCWGFTCVWLLCKINLFQKCKLIHIK